MDIHSIYIYKYIQIYIYLLLILSYTLNVRYANDTWRYFEFDVTGLERW